MDIQHSNNRGYQNKDPSQIRYYKCNKIGHTARNCYNFTKKKRRPKTLQQDHGRSLNYHDIYRCMRKDKFPYYTRVVFVPFLIIFIDLKLRNLFVVHMYILVIV